MGEESSSWIMRTKYSHTVCHRIDSSRLTSAPFTVLPNRTSTAAKSRPATRRRLDVIQLQRSPSTNKARAVSPYPEIKLSDTFKEAQSNQRRSSTSTPRRREHNKGIVNRLLHHSDSHGGNSHCLKFHDKSRSRKELGWAKYLDHAGERATSVDAADEHTIDLSKLFLGLRFAHGANSQLYHGIYMDKPVAVKMIRVVDDPEKRDLAARLENQYTREVTLLSHLHHKNVIKFIGSCRKPAVFCIVTEYLPEGSLWEYMHKLEHEPLPVEKLISMALDIARAMEYVHSQGVIHRDLKPENILISDEFHLKVADFGIACEEAYCDLLQDEPGSYRWMAPEMIKRKHYSRKVDVYAFGLILWELVSGSTPYEDMMPIQAACAVLNKNMRPIVPEDCPLAMKALIEQCWSLQSDKRPEFWQIVKVLEEFESSFERDGSLNLMQNKVCHDRKKGLLQWIQKLGPSHTTPPAIPKPKIV